LHSSMSSTACCGICRGELRLRFPGSLDVYEPQDLSPTSHLPGVHGDILRCQECGTLQQPALLTGDLSRLYRDMRDVAYLDEEPGRRQTARRLLERIEGQMPGGRLLDIGCGPGLLLDEARRRGYLTAGLEPADSARAYAGEQLGLDVSGGSLEEFTTGETFDVITIVDVLEHLADPVAAIERCYELLAPDGVLCVVTPDPTSLSARFAGRRWWGLIPAHSYLLPHNTLLELLVGNGFAVAADTPIARSFSLGYWIQKIAGLVRRHRTRRDGRKPRPGLRPLVSLSLGERAVVVTKVVLHQPERRLVTDRGQRPSVHIVLPAYNAESTIAQVADGLPIEAADRALLVDDASTDATTAVALSHGFEVIRHPVNRGYGANQKTCYVRAALDGADIAVMVHADHQYDPRLVAEMVRPIIEGRADVVIGSRLLNDEAIIGGMPRWKWIGNRLLTTIENAAFRRSHSEYHTGYRAFSIEFLRTVPFLRNSDGFVFDQEIFAQIVARDGRVTELPIPTRYFLEASSVSFSRSVEYGLRTLWVLARFRYDRRRGRWTLLRAPAARLMPTGSSARVSSASANGR
jgi:glycosyltransferase involved in cell wall biosynthesis